MMLGFGSTHHLHPKSFSNYGIIKEITQQFDSFITEKLEKSQFVGGKFNVHLMSFENWLINILLLMM